MLSNIGGSNFCPYESHFTQFFFKLLLEQFLKFLSSSTVNATKVFSRDNSGTQMLTLTLVYASLTVSIYFLTV
jgi:hypothetical protein